MLSAGNAQRGLRANLQPTERNAVPALGAEAVAALIHALESRIDHKPALAEQALREGYVMTPAFVELHHLIWNAMREEVLKAYERNQHKLAD